ncbi:hypothetical protein LX99_00792 [Mucilaginibacter oryzae]|uniref:Uncharacterized protein n=1 Tax=Mucilaginibacter oryzae TaxID=468058 RepID=A0A316HJ38_9SPHI|nr:hypothetical protein LX99_00792 [Mucilaginibacter oryzae]
MRKVLTEAGIFLLNLATIFIFQILSPFVIFFLYGEGVSADKQYQRWPIIFAAIQILIVVILYANKVLYKRKLSLILSITTIVAFCLYFICNSI